MTSLAAIMFTKFFIKLKKKKKKKKTSEIKEVHFHGDRSSTCIDMQI